MFTKVVFPLIPHQVGRSVLVIGWLLLFLGCNSNTNQDAPAERAIFLAAGGSSGSDGFVLSSEDGIVWSATLSEAPPLKDIAYNGQTFIAVGNSGAIYQSPDGNQWTSVTSGLSINLTKVVAVNEVFVAMGDDGSNISLFQSTDGSTWTTITHDLPSGTLTDARAANSVILLASGNSLLLSSNFGVSWTSQSSGLIFPITAITHNRSQFGIVSSTGEFAVSLDGQSWNPGTSMPTAVTALQGVDSQWVGLNTTGTIHVTSDNGATWSSTDSGLGSTTSLTSSQSLLMIANQSGQITTSTDLVNFSPQTSGTSTTIEKIEAFVISRF